MAEAERIVAPEARGRRVEAEHGAPLPPIGPAELVVPQGSLTEVFHQPYRARTIMLVVFNIFQTVGFYGFANWVPTLLIKQASPSPPACSTPSSSPSPRRSARYWR